MIYSEDGDNKLKIEGKMMIEYDESGNKMRIIVQSADSLGVINNDLRMEVNCLTEVHIRELIVQEWAGEAWENDIREVANFHPISETLMDQQLYLWDDGAWGNVMNASYNYTSSGLLDYILYEAWNDEWEKEFQVDFTYQSSDRPTVLTFSSWDETEMSPLYRTLLTYNEYDQVTEAYMEYYEEGTWVADEWENRWRFYYEEYDEQTDVVEPRIENVFTLYPNPAEDKVTVKSKSDRTISNIRIVDLSGKVVYQTDMREMCAQELNLSLNHLADGMYFMQVYCGLQYKTIPLSLYR